MDKEKAIQNLLDITRQLYHQGLNYFLIDGTLLGAIRDKDFIGHDTDIDLGVFMEEWTIDKFTEFTNEMMKQGFLIYHTFGIFGEHFEASFRRDGIKVDLFFYYYPHDEEENEKQEYTKIRFNAFNNGGRTLPDDIITFEYPAVLFSELKQIEFKGYLFFAPSSPLDVLELKYGTDWMTPTKKWNWATSPKNIIATGQFI